MPDPAAVVEFKGARFTVLSAALIRMQSVVVAQHTPGSPFDDRATAVDAAQRNSSKGSLDSDPPLLEDHRV